MLNTTFYLIFKHRVILQHCVRISVVIPCVCIELLRPLELCREIWSLRRLLLWRARYYRTEVVKCTMSNQSRGPGVVNISGFRLNSESHFSEVIRNSSLMLLFWQQQLDFACWQTIDFGRVGQIFMVRYASMSLQWRFFSVMKRTLNYSLHIG